MPTAARLMAALCLAVVGLVVSEMVKPLMPESTDFGYFVQVNIVLGLGVGWFVMGRRAGRGILDVHHGLFQYVDKVRRSAARCQIPSSR